MAKLRLDLRKTLRSIAVAAQAANLDRLLSGQAVNGGAVVPQKPRHTAASRSRKRIRLFGIRVRLADLAGRLGVATGALLRDLSRRGNIKVGRTSFKIVPSPEVILRWRVLNAGSPHQAARPVSGMSGEQLDEAAAEISADARDQFVAALRDRISG